MGKEEITRKIRKHFKPSSKKTHHIKIYKMQVQQCLEGYLWL